MSLSSKIREKTALRLSLMGIGILLIFPLILNAGIIDDLQSQITEKQNIIRELEKQAAEYKEEINQIQSEERTLKNTIAIFEKEISRLNVEIQLTQSRIEAVSLKIQEIQIEIENKEKDVERQKIILAEIIRYIHEYDETDFLELLLRTNDLSDIFNQAGYMEMLQGEIQNKVEVIKKLKSQLEEQKNQLDEEKIAQENLKSQLDGQKQVQLSQKKDKDWLLTETRRSEWRYQNLLSEIEEKQRQAFQEIAGLEDEIRMVLDPGLVPSPRSGVLSWPTEGILTQGYGCIETRFARRIYPSCNDGSGGFHNGLDIAAATGTLVYAPRDGTVIASGNASYAYGNWLAVEHDNGLITLYAHLAAKKVSVGDTIVREKTIMGLMGATGYVTGSHLHFTVYAPGSFTTKPSEISGILPLGASLDPMDYL